MGLSQFGARLERLPPGSRSSHRHWHETEDEFVFVLSGELVLVENEESVLRAGDAAAWAAGQPTAHCLENRSEEAAVYLVVGSRAPRGAVHYPDHDVVMLCALFLGLASVEAFADAVPAVAALRARGLRVGICSNLASPYAVPARLLLPPMDAYGFSFTVGAIKPEAQIYRAVCAALELQPKQVLMVGDTLEADVIGPLRFGMRAVHLVRDGSASPAPHRIVALAELPQML